MFRKGYVRATYQLLYKIKMLAHSIFRFGPSNKIIHNWFQMNSTLERFELDNTIGTNRDYGQLITFVDQNPNLKHCKISASAN